MTLDDFDFVLPAALIAQRPAPRRDASRLLVLERASGVWSHHRFHELPDLLATGDLLVLNDTRVRPARIWARKPSGGRVELLLLEPEHAEEGIWRCWLRATRKPAPGTRLAVGAELEATVLERRDDVWRVRFEGHAPARALERVGRMPLPPYIRREPDDPLDPEDRERYQTVFARHTGAIAAPTAGLHFTPELLRRLEARGIESARLTLHVGAGTFEPVRVHRIEDHRMHPEVFELGRPVAQAIAATRARGGRVVAVGTTVVRVLEHCADGSGGVTPQRGRTALFIRPGFAFGVIDALITNFHLPRSTLLMLVAAFAGREQLLRAYREAVEREYRFYSYGDAMLIGSQR